MSNIVLDISSDHAKVFLLSRWSTDINLALTKKSEIIVADIPSRKVMCGTKRDLLTPGSALNVFYVEKAGGSSVHKLGLFQHTLLVTHRGPALRIPNPCLYKSDVSFSPIESELTTLNKVRDLLKEQIAVNRAMLEALKKKG